MRIWRVTSCCGAASAVRSVVQAHGSPHTTTAAINRPIIPLLLPVETFDIAIHRRDGEASFKADLQDLDFGAYVRLFSMIPVD